MHRFKEICFVGWLAIWLLAGCAGYAALVLCTANTGELARLVASFPQQGPTGRSAEADFEKLRVVLASAALGLGALGIALAWRSPQRAWRGLAQSWHCLRPAQRRLAWAVFAALTLLRFGVSRVLATFDDTASYEFFVRKSLLAVSAYYPAPNNHIFSNTLSWLFYQAYPGYWWSMRVPVLLLSTAGTAGWFLGVLRRSNFRVAAFATTLFSLLELSLFYAAEGRGYALLVALSSLGFFCTLSLTDSTTKAVAPVPAVAWLGLLVAGTLGLYTVPTFAYFLVAAYSWLGIHWLRRACFQRLLSLVLLGTATLLGAALLYTPLLLVSGPSSLFQNVYVKPLTASAFFRQLPAYWWEVEGGLMGESHNGVLASMHVGSLAAVVVMVGFVALAGAARRGHLPAPSAAYILRLGVPALWFALLPYSLLMAQHVQAPIRTLWFKAAFMFVLAGLEVDWLLHQFRTKAYVLRLGLLLATGSWAGVQLVQLYRSNELRLSYLRTPYAAAHWLLQQPPGPVRSTSSAWDLTAIRFFIHFEQPTSSLEIDEDTRPGVRYRYYVGPPATYPTPPSAVGLPRLHIDPSTNSEAMDVVGYW